MPVLFNTVDSRLQRKLGFFCVSIIKKKVPLVEVLPILESSPVLFVRVGVNVYMFELRKLSHLSITLTFHLMLLCMCIPEETPKWHDRRQIITFEVVAKTSTF